MAQPLSVSNEAVIAKYRERMAAVLHENLVLSAAVEDLQAQVADRDARIAALQLPREEATP